MTVNDAARWMLAELDREGVLYQDFAAFELVEKLGDECAYLNDNGNLAISREVLKAFRKLSGDRVVWERGSRCWRKREEHDGPGRQQE